MDLGEDQSLYEDLCLLSESGQGQLPLLISRLDTTLTRLKLLCEKGKKENATHVAVRLVTTYFNCLNCTKVSKHIVTVLSRVPPCLKSTVESQMKVKIQEIVADSYALSKVSGLLEQCQSGRGLIRSHLSHLCQCLYNVMKTCANTPPPQLTRDDAVSLQLAVKISLQLIQHFRDDIKKVIYQKTHSMDSDMTETFSKLVQALLTLLSQNGHESDVYQFVGTSLAMLMNLISGSQSAAETFWNIIKILNNGNGNCCFGNLLLNVESKEHYHGNSIAELALVRAVIVCSQEDILMAACQQKFEEGGANSVYGSRGDNPLLLALFPVVLRYCDYQKTSEYYSFQVLSLWFQRLQKSILQLNLMKDISFTSRDSPYLKNTLKLVFLHWDSPVDGVTDYVGEIFQCVLAVWSREKVDGKTDNVCLSEELLQQLLSVAWNVKGKYKLIGLLLPYTDIRKVIQTSHLKQHLLQCMGTNNLAPIAADVYKVCLMQTKNMADEDRLKHWKESWLEVLLAGLLSDEPLLCKKLSDYWIPLTLKLVPVSGMFLPSYLSDQLQQCGCSARSPKLLFVWLLVVRIIRSIRGMDEKKFNVPLLTKGLYSEDEDTRGEVVAFLCGSMRKSELLFETECHLLKSCLPLCLRVDSAPFRQHLTANIKKLMVRLRDGCLSAIKKKQDAHMETSLKFLDWLHGTLIDSLFPGSSYQRRKTCLDLLSVLYETLVYIPGSATQQRGQAGERCVPVLDYAHKQGLCDFFTHNSTVAVMDCIIDGADEVQELSCQVLMRFYPWSVPHAPYSVSDLACHLLYNALQLCRSPRPYESRSGALLCNILYVKYACEQGIVFERQTGGIGAASFTCEQTQNASGYQFIKLLLNEMQISISRAEEDSVKASKESPLHGLIQAITLCLRNRSSCGDLDNLLLRLVKVNVKVIEMTLSVMSGGSTKENCPSFAEMGMALGSLVSDGEGESLSLTPDFQILLSWCWVNLKESCTCLGELTSALVKSPTSDSATWLPDILNVGRVFIQVLTNCRVRGAIEGCRNGLLKYCTVLLASEDKSLSSVPADILKQILTSLESNVMSVSVTRRSAGLPIIVQVIAQAEHKLKQHQLLTSTVDRLFHLASLPFTTEIDQKQDLVQVHALNILKAVFGDASLVVSLMSSYTKVILIIFDGFESPSWAIRNAATQLFGIMVSRMFGPRGKGGSGQNIMTLPELSAHYPGLPKALLERLNTGITDVHNIDSVSPSLFLVLTLLANLGPVELQKDAHRYDIQFKEKISACLETPVYTIRELSAQAYVAFVPLKSGEQEVVHLADSLPASPTDMSTHNSLHGTLLCIEKLILGREFRVNDKHRFLTVFLTKSWILTKLSNCPLLGAKYVQIIRHLIHGLSLEDIEVKNIVTLIQNYSATGHSNQLQIGTGLVVRDSIACLTNILRERREELTNLLCEWLQSDIIDVCLSSMDVLSGLIKDNKANTVVWAEIMAKLWSMLLRTPDALVQTAAMHLLSDVRLSELSASQTDFGFEDLHRLTSQSYSKSSLHAASIPVEAILVDNNLKGLDTLDASLMSHVHAWCRRVTDASDPMQSENLRTAAVTALLIAGQTTLSVCLKTPKCSIAEDILICLIESVLRLLEDGHVDIRKMATRFVSSLRWDGRQVQLEDVNSTTCQQIFCQYISDNLCWSVTVGQYLLEKIYKPGEATTVCKNNRVNSRCEVLFEQEENSVLSERPLQQVLLYNTVKTSFAKEAVLPKFYLATVATETLNDLVTCIPILEKSLHGSPFMNITSDASVLSAITGLVLVADVFLTMADDVDVTVLQGLHKGLANLSQMKNLHPWLISRVNDCLSCHLIKTT